MHVTYIGAAKFKFRLEMAVLDLEQQFKQVYFRVSSTKQPSILGLCAVNSFNVEGVITIIIIISITV